MKAKDKRQNRGFTIIEVVLVLAVAGLIFLVVFAAVPRLQASRRDNQRKRDVEAALSLIVDFQSNVGRNPTSAEWQSGVNSGTGIFADYVPTNFDDPSGSAYVASASYTTFDVNDGEMVYGDGQICSPTSLNRVTATGADDNDVAVIVNLERGFYCVDA